VLNDLSKRSAEKSKIFGMPKIENFPAFAKLRSHIRPRISTA